MYSSIWTNGIVTITRVNSFRYAAAQHYALATEAADDFPGWCVQKRIRFRGAKHGRYFLYLSTRSSRTPLAIEASRRLRPISAVIRALHMLAASSSIVGATNVEIGTSHRDPAELE
ncbi:MAG: hypothetical protein ACRYGI_20180 [Janthinobacterium lividum]